MNRKYTLLAILAWLYDEGNSPLWMLPWALRPGSPFFERIRQGVKEPQIAYELSQLERLADSATKLDERVGGAERLLSEKFDEACFKYRTEPTFDFLEFVKNKGIFIVTAGNADPSTVSMMFRLYMLQTSVMVSDYFATHNEQPLPIREYVDEAANLKLIGEPEAQGLAQHTKRGKTTCIITQVPSFGDPDINQAVMQNTPNKVILCCAPPVSEIAAEILKVNLDPYLVHHVDRSTRQLHDGFTQELRESKTFSGNGISTSKGWKDVPIYTDVTEEKKTYFHLNDQKLMNEVEIEKLKRGECFLATEEGVFKHTFGDWKDPGVVPGFSERKVQRHIQWLREQGILRPPVQVDYGAWLPKESVAKPKAGQNARERGQRKGNRKPSGS